MCPLATTLGGRVDRRVCRGGTSPDRAGWRRSPTVPTRRSGRHTREEVRRQMLSMMSSMSRALRLISLTSMLASDVTRWTHSAASNARAQPQLDHCRKKRTRRFYSLLPARRFMALPVTGALVRTFVPQEICRPHGRQWKRNRLRARSVCCARHSAPTSCCRGQLKLAHDRGAVRLAASTNHLRGTHKDEARFER